LTAASPKVHHSQISMLQMLSQQRQSIPLAMLKTNPGKKELIRQIVHLEILLGDQQESLIANEHKNTLVIDCLSKVDQILQKAVVSIAKGEIETTSHLTTIAWLYINFARQITTAEMMEIEIGESDFFGLIESDTSLSASLKYEFEAGQNLVIQLLKRIRQKSKSSQ
jgi:hypothetical protein